jgi:hypothetical protein
MADATSPSEEQKQRAKWDLLLLDLEHRADQIRATREPIRASRQDMWLNPWQVGFAGMTAGAALFAAGAAFMKLAGG